jgi:hypothetical protein
MSLNELLAHPAVQGGLAPLLAGLLVAGLGFPLRLSGLAAGAGFLTVLYLTGNLVFEPLSATRKVAVLGLAAPVFGAVADLAFRPTRAAGVVLGALFAAAAAWAFWGILAQKPTAEALIYGAGIAVFLLCTVAFAISLHAEPVRAGAAGLGLGLGAGIGAILGASALLGLYGIALGAASGGFLLLTMALGKRVTAGASFTLAASVTAALVGATAMLLAKLPWYALAVLALVPLAVRLPVPERSHPALQAVVASVYALAVAAAACAVSWVWPR